MFVAALPIFFVAEDYIKISTVFHSDKCEL